MSSTPSYAYRHHVLSSLLDGQPSPSVTSNAFAISSPSSHQSAEDLRFLKLDALLLRGWSRKGKQVDSDSLHRIETLRLKRADFETIGTIGDGQFGTVEVVRCAFDRQLYALKTIRKTTASRAGPQLSLAQERHMHLLARDTRTAPAPKLVAAFQTGDSLSLVTTYAACGSLWDRLCSLSSEAVSDHPESKRKDEQTIMREDELRWWAAQMVNAIDWTHSQGFAHRDIKPHNFVIHHNAQLLLTDFGSAAPLQHPDNSFEQPYVPVQWCQLPVGTPDYVAPEVLIAAEQAVVDAAIVGSPRSENQDVLLRYDATIDWWSLGATLYELATGQAPFWARSIEHTYQKLTRYKGDLSMPVVLSPELADLLKSLIALPPKRLSTHCKISQHGFFKTVDWQTCGKGSSSGAPISILPVDLAHLSKGSCDGKSTLNQDDQMTFSHLFEESSMATDSSSAMNTQECLFDHPDPLCRWLGWSWEPPASAFRPSSDISLTLPSNNALGQLLLPAPTPVRPIPATPKTWLSSNVDGYIVPGTQVRTRPVSERKAFEEMVMCVQTSAKRRLAVVHPLDRNTSFEAHPVPPTPTPMSRENSLFARTPRIAAVGGSLKQAALDIHRPLSLPDLQAMHSSLADKLSDLGTQLSALRRRTAV